MKAREELLRDIGALKREAEYWELEAKRLVVKYHDLKKDLTKAKAELELWKGTAP
mgnify:FL=1|jgi:hypothetical protein